jgi:hypothetical protein
MSDGIGNDGIVDYGSVDYGGGGDTSSFNYGGAINAGGSIIGGIGAFVAGQATAGADRAQAAADLAKAAGYNEESTAYSEAAGYAAGNVQLAEESTAIKTYQNNRLVNRAIGAQRAQIGGAGFTESGSGLDILRSSAQQGALATGLIGVQGAINEQGYLAQQSADVALSQEATTAANAATAAAGDANKAAGAAETGGIIGAIGGVIKGGFGIASLFK